MRVQFYKYQGTGNDFIMLDNRQKIYDGLTIEQIQFLCDRRFGVGADGLILINTHAHYDFEVDYSNPDGSKSFCGNGARCSVAFAQSIGIDCSAITFLAIDGEHQAKMSEGIIAVEMQNVIELHEIGNDFQLNTGSPHYIRFVENAEAWDIVKFGKEIRYSEQYALQGINVNLVEKKGDELLVKTYERGVEDETFSCGTGVTAAAIAYAYKDDMKGHRIFDIQVKGGKLKVDFVYEAPQQFTNIWLSGPAVMSFKGEIDV